MTWMVKLLKKLVSPLDAWESVPNEDPKDLANTESLLKFDDLVLAVLEKNKEIEKNNKKARKINNKQCPTLKELRWVVHGSYGLRGKEAEAHAFRELVEVCQTNRNTRKGVEAVEKVGK